MIIDPINVKLGGIMYEVNGMADRTALLANF